MTLILTKNHPKLPVKPIKQEIMLHIIKNEKFASKWVLISTINLLDIANGRGAMTDTKLPVKTTKWTLIIGGHGSEISGGRELEAGLGWSWPA